MFEPTASGAPKSSTTIRTGSAQGTSAGAGGSGSGQPPPTPGSGSAPQYSPENDVHLLVDWTFRPLANGSPTSMTMHHYWRLREGQVEYFRGSEDSALTAAAFGA